MQQHSTYHEDTLEQSKKRRRLNELSLPPMTMETQCLFCNMAIERSSREEFWQHMEHCLTQLTEGNQIRRNKHRSGAFSSMTTCPACNEDSPFDFKSMRDKARHLKQCLISNGTTLSNVLDARDNGNAPIDLSSPSSPPPIYQGNNNIDLTIIDEDDDNPFSSQPPLEEFEVANDKRRNSLLSDESPLSYTHADIIIDNSQKDDIDLTVLDGSPPLLVDTWSQRQGSVNGDLIEEQANDSNNPLSPSPYSQRLDDDDDTYEGSDQQQYSPMEDECLVQLLLDRLCLEQQFTPSPFFTQLKSCATHISNSVEARRRSLDTFEKVFFNQQLNLLELSTKNRSTLMQDSHRSLSQTQAQFLYNVIKEMQTPECTAGITWVYDDYSLDGNTLMAIERLTELDSRLARVLCLLDIACHHPMFAHKSNTHQDVIQRRETQCSVDDDDGNSVVAVDLTGNSDHSLEEIILSSASDIVELDFNDDDEASIQSHSDVAQSQQVDEYRSRDSSTPQQQAGGQNEDSCSLGFNTPPNVHAKDDHLSDKEEDEDTNFHCGNLTNRELNFFADAYGLERGMRKQTIALLNRIWKERAHQENSSIDDEEEPRSMDGSSKAVELVRHLKSRQDIWNKILRYECVDLEDYGGSNEDFTCDQIRKELDYHGFLKKSK